MAMQATRRDVFTGLGAGLAALSAPGLAQAPSAPHPPRLTPENFRTLIDHIDGAEGIAALPDGRVVYSTDAAAIGLWRPASGAALLGEAHGTGGVAVDPQGRALLASVGLLHNRPGPLRRIDLTTGASEVLVSHIDGRELVTSNCPAAASDGMIYCSHTGWSIGNIGTTAREGFIYARWPDGRVEVVAKGLRGVNGLCLAPDERRLYAVLTAEGRVMSWRRKRDGRLGQPRQEGPVLGTVVANQLARDIRALPVEARSRTGYCDGLAFDRHGNLWVTLPFANRIVAITPRGKVFDVVSDPAGTMIDFPTNLAFTGPNRHEVLIVSRGSGRIVAARVG